ncbi:kinase-like protein [Aspergillus campestris IBT 28561]|uniref:Kinase-like protein n=1 Tax=Aspergillus campestris (strain IBT 28561) TaxID=1392248 RepID=A0A2I1CR44_ASPC2|nr:kinase-like protein [Aspergillus campestris IBT 28561]PKY00101.1 kinase-like protein [Aspergillus campestris IBT 28561]
MLTSLRRSFPQLRQRWAPLTFSNPNCARISALQAIEEETIPDYIATWYYPTQIGENLKDRYQVVGKLGYCRYVALKVFINSTSMGQQLDDELNIYRSIEGASQKCSHPGHKYIRSLLDTFDIDGPEEKHRCLVHPPLWESVLAFLFRNPIQRLLTPVLAVVLHRLFLALDYLHTACNIIHTDIKADNLMFGIDDDSVFHDFEANELQQPSPRKELDGRTVYISRELRMPKRLGPPVLSDFGSAVFGDEEHTEDVQPDVYRAPEVILQAPWTYSIDVWNAGCMVWNLYEGGSLFSGYDPEFQAYRSRAHLAEMISLLGPPPQSFIARGQLTKKFFSEEGTFSAGIPIEKRVSLEERESSLEGVEKEKFLCLVRKMLQWEPGKRSFSKALIEDEWLQRELHK